MSAKRLNPKVDAYIRDSVRWHKELDKLRKILLASPLTEELKWGVPCYTVDNHNVVLMHVFKEYCALLFVKGALLKDENHILIQQTENVQAGRHVRFTDVKEIAAMQSVLRAYIQQAIEIEKSGVKVDLKKTSEFKVADEFQLALDEMPALKAAFERLTPGRQRAYLLYFSSPKQSKTRESRVLKCMPRILSGKGLND